MGRPEGMPIYKRWPDKVLEVEKKASIVIGVLTALAASGVGIAIATLAYIGGRAGQKELRKGYA